MSVIPTQLFIAYGNVQRVFQKASRGLGGVADRVLGRVVL